MSAFIDPGNHLIFMDMQTRYEEPLIRLPEEDIQALSDAGIKTAMMFHTDWNIIEPVKGERDFSYYDQRIELLKRCGMRVMIQCFTYIPNWVPDSWLVRNFHREVHRMISPWNSEALIYALGFYKEMCDRYTSSDVMVINSWLTDGETLFPNEPCIYDDFAIREFNNEYLRPPNADGIEERKFLHAAQIKLICDIQGILRNNQYGDIWLAIHPALAGYRGNGCEYLEDMLANLNTRYPCATINQLYCTWRQWSGLYPEMNRLRDTYGTRVFGGAEYAEGVMESTLVAATAGINGLLINPCHPHTGHPRVLPWMLDNIRHAVRMWKDSKCLI
jgi:hypothetical protein